MANSAVMISLKYNASLNRAEQLVKISDTIGQHINRLNDCSGRINYEWDGENSDRFISKLNLIAENLKSIERDLNNVSETIRRVSNRTYASEMQALEISKRRSYSGGA